MKFKTALRQNEQGEINTYNLKDLLEGIISVDKNAPIFISDRAVDYDLLEREEIINRVNYALCTCKPDECFVISLEGAWGSGKTTIINNVKKQLLEEKHTIIIDNFDPWIYGNNNSMLTSLFDAMLLKSGINFSFFNAKQTVNSVINSISINSPIGGRIKLNRFRADPCEIRKMKDRIDEFLNLSDKRFVVIIDNLDRAESESIITLFKIIGQLFNSSKIIFLLSFDSDRVKRALKHSAGIDYTYVEKLIQMRIRVPQISADKRSDLFDNCTRNLLRAYGTCENDVHQFDLLIDCISTNIKDIREYKRLINSVFPVVNNALGLYKKDLLCIEYLFFSFPDVYEEIRKNRKYFVSHDLLYDEKLYEEIWRKDELNASGKVFFDNLFSSKDKSLLELLSTVFPYVKRYKNKQDLIREYQIEDPDFIDIETNERICSAKFFDLYFSLTDNFFTRVGTTVEKAMTDINSAKTQEQVDLAIRELFNCLNNNNQIEIMERLELHLRFIDSIKAEYVLTPLFENIRNVDKRRPAFRLSAYDRLLVIISDLLIKIPYDNFNVFLQKRSKEYDKIGVFSTIVYWMESTKNDKDEARIATTKSVLAIMCNEVIEKRIDIYSNKYYNFKNIWGMARYYKDMGSLEALHNYLSSIISAENVFRVIGDTIGDSISEKVSYYISKETWESLLGELDVDKILNETRPKTDNEIFVLNVYNDFKNGELDDFGDPKGIVFDDLI